ncbi:unnamed protein product [Rhizopus stolonifer]
MSKLFTLKSWVGLIGHLDRIDYSNVESCQLARVKITEPIDNVNNGSSLFTKAQRSLADPVNATPDTLAAHISTHADHISLDTFSITQNQSNQFNEQVKSFEGQAQ